MKSYEEEIQIDFDKLPRSIGTIRTEVPGKKRIYDIHDAEEVIDWIEKKIPAGRKVSVIVIGSMPPWLAMSVIHFLDTCGNVERVRYNYPNMPMYCVFEKCPEVMV